MVLVDASVWSLALRRRINALSSAETLLTTELERLIRRGETTIIGSVRQEVLSGIRDDRAFNAILSFLSAFPLLPTRAEDYDRAAAFYNICRARGITGTATDMLICSVASAHDEPVFTTDRDFARYAVHLPIRLYEIDSN